jgi:hypothetical protein
MTSPSNGSATGTATLSAKGGYTGRSAAGSAEGSSDLLAKSTIIELRSSQDVVVSSAQRNPSLRDSQVVVKSMFGIPAEGIFSSQDVAKALIQIEAKFEYNTQLVRKVDAQWMPSANASQVAVLSLVRSNPDKRELRAYSFFQDGHWFYVLHLGNQSTLVFDTTTRKWSEWRTTDFNNWRANYVVNWQSAVLGGDVSSNMVFDVAPSYDSDVTSPIVSVITGGIPVRWDNSISCDGVMVTSSAGMSTGTVTAPSIGLRTSDDYGLTWQDWGTQDLTDWTPTFRLQWSSLGNVRAPGRIFEITDNGASKRINSLRLFSRDTQ